MKEKSYVEPEMEILCFAFQDILLTSACVGDCPVELPGCDEVDLDG